MDILDIAIAKQLAGGGGGSGTDNYNDLSNLPKINDVTLSGNKSSSALGLQSEITSENKLDSDLIDDTDQDNKFVTSSEKNIWNAKQNAIDADHKLNADYVDDSTSTNKFVTASDKEAWNAKQNAIDNSHKLSSDLVDDANHTNKFVTSTEKNTWNGKQNAIDSEHKLSSSLVSFTTAEAAALASGIDSAKVAQISTNQSNILYALNTGVKNLFDLKNADITSYPTNISVSKGDNSITVTSAGNKTWSHIAIPITLEAGSYHVLATISNRTAATSAISRFIVCTNANGSGELGGNTFTANGTIDFGFTTTGGTIYLTPYPNYNATGYDSSFTASDIMICTGDAWNQSHDFMPYALPNYDLTRLEAEDRAGLVDVVDSGAKNLLDLSSTDTSSITKSEAITITRDSANEFTITRAASPTAVQEVKIPIPTSFPTNKYVILSGCPSNGAYATYSVEVWENNAYLSDAGGDYGSGTKEFKFSTTTGRFIRIRFGDNTSFSNLKFKFMCCTKAAFGVSPKFVPYRPSYDDLIENTKAVAVSPSDFFRKASTDFTVDSNTRIYKQGNHIFGTLIMYKNTEYAALDVTVGTINSNYRPSSTIIGQSYYHTSPWSVNAIGYSFISTTGDVVAKPCDDAGGKYKYAIIPISYAI